MKKALYLAREDRGDEKVIRHISEERRRAVRTANEIYLLTYVALVHGQRTHTIQYLWQPVEKA